MGVDASMGHIIHARTVNSGQ